MLNLKSKFHKRNLTPKKNKEPYNDHKYIALKDCEAPQLLDMAKTDPEMYGYYTSSVAFPHHGICQGLIAYYKYPTRLKAFCDGYKRGYEKKVTEAECYVFNDAVDNPEDWYNNTGKFWCQIYEMTEDD